MSLTFDADRHQYRWNGKVVPSVTQILKPISPDFLGIPKDTLEYARQLGVAVDATITMFEKSVLDESSLSATLKLYLEAWLSFKEMTQFTVLGTQEMVCNRTANYAGTLDVVGKFPGECDSIIDIKRTFTIPAHVGPQTAAYAEAWVKGGPTKRFALHLKPKDSRVAWRLEPLTDKNDLNVFMSCLVIHRFNEARQ